MSVENLTARSVEALKPRLTRYLVRDQRVSGLELRVQSDGAKVWTLRYRVNGHQRRLKLGVFRTAGHGSGTPPRMTLASARTAAMKELRKVDGGIDPQAERQKARAAAAQAQRDTIEALCDSYITRHAKPRKRTWRDDQSKIACEILPHWRSRPVASITRRDCRELLQAIADRPAPIYANRIAALLSRLFRFAVDEELIAANPAARLPKAGAEAHARPAERKAYDADEIRAVWAATEDLSPAPRAIYRLGLLTGQRPSEISGLEWAEIDGAWWTLPGRRTKNGRDHRVYLTGEALAELARVPREDDRYAFAGSRGKRQVAELNARVFANVRRREKPRHALRDTVATGLAAAGVDVEDIARVLNHTYGPRVTAGYNAYGYDREKRLALLKWARRLAGIVVATPACPDTVLPFTKGA